MNSEDQHPAGKPGYYRKGCGCLVVLGLLVLLYFLTKSRQGDLQEVRMQRFAF